MDEPSTPDHQNERNSMTPSENPNSDSTAPPPVQDPNANIVHEVVNSEIGVSTLLNRLKQSIASAKEFALFLKKRSILEEEHSSGLKKLCRITADSIRKPEQRHGSYLQSYEELTMLHERMADNGSQFAVSLLQMHEDLMELTTNIERSRKHWKTTGLAAEQRVADTEAAMRKSKAKYDSLAEDYDRVRTGDKQAGKKFGLKGPKSAQQHEEDTLRKTQAADADYLTKVQTAQTQRAELWQKLRPDAVKAIDDLIKECDSALTLQMQKFASFNEKLLLSNGLNISPLKNNEGANQPRSLREVVEAIDNDRDLSNYISSFGSRVGPRPPEIKYEKNPVLNPPAQITSPLPAPNTNPAPGPQRQSDPPAASFNSRQGPPQGPPQSYGSMGPMSGSQMPSQMSPPYSRDPLPQMQQQQQRDRSYSQGQPMQPYGNGSMNSRGPPQGPPGGPQRGPGHNAYHTGSISSPSGAYSSISSSGPPQLSTLPFQTSQTPPPNFPQPPPPAQSLSQPKYAPSPTAASSSQLPPLKPVFGLSLEQLFERDASAVPMVVYQCIQAVDLFGLEVEGIYRLSGTSSHISKIKALFDNDASKVDFRNPENFFHDVNSVAGLLKQFFRDLPDPLLTSENYAGFIEAAKNDDDIVRRDSLHAIINSLPDPNYATLRALTLHLNRVQESSPSNRMNSSNLAIVFGPTLMGANTGSAISDSGWQVRVVDTILNNTYQIFDDDD